MCKLFFGSLNKSLVMLFVITSLALSAFFPIFHLASSNINKIAWYEKKMIDLGHPTKIIGYEFSSSEYKTLHNDPQLYYIGMRNKVSAVKIEFAEPLAEQMTIQIYYATEGKPLMEKNSVAAKAKKEQVSLILELPFDVYQILRVDIGDKEGQSFKLKGISYSSQKRYFYFLSYELLLNVKCVVAWLSIAAVVFFAMLLVAVNINKIYSGKDNQLQAVFMVFSFLMFVAWALIQPFNAAPDERMRYDVIKYVYDYEKLPHGGDPVIRNPIWGFSYAFLPYLSGLVSVVFIKLMSFFSNDSYSFIFAARLAVVCFGTLTVFFIIQISNKIFLGIYRWLFIVLVCCLPQFVFLGSFMNNDMLALLGVSVMLNYWLEGQGRNWDIMSCVGLGVGVSISLLAYYNIYPFVFFSVVFFLVTAYNHDIKIEIIIKKFLFIFILVFALSGWWFIRNAIIYDGDFLGLSTANEYKIKFAMDHIAKSTAPYMSGTLMHMLFEMNWVKTTFYSFIGVFGYMNISIHSWMYDFYFFVIGCGLASYIFNFSKLNKNSIFLHICLLFASIMTFSLSIINSYFNGFQAQGRYVIASLIPLMIYVTFGFERLLPSVERYLHITKNLVISCFCAALIMLSVICFFSIMLPTYGYEIFW